jgi:hypothetical protein
VLVVTEVVGSSRFGGDRGAKAEQCSPEGVHCGTRLGTQLLDTDEGVADSDNRGIACWGLNCLDVEDSEYHKVTREGAVDLEYQGMNWYTELCQFDIIHSKKGCDPAFSLSTPCQEDGLEVWKLSGKAYYQEAFPR